jgi:hypothetical protein
MSPFDERADSTPLQLPEAFEPDWAPLESATSESTFMAPTVELLKEAVALSLMAAGVVPSAPFARDDAIRCGLLVRIGRLGGVLVRDVCVGDGDQQMSISRQLMDSTATMLYLIEDDDDGGRHAAFETRSRRSIARSAKAAGVDLDSLPSRKAIGWESAEERMKLLGPTSYPAYRMGSAALHGTWNDIYRNYLIEVDGGFLPRFQIRSPRPQPLTACTVLITTAATAYLGRRPVSEREVFEHRLHDLDERTRRLDALHEEFLSR